MVKRKEAARPAFTVRQNAFIDEVMSGKGGGYEEVAERVGYHRGSARHLKATPKVAAEIRRRQEEARERSDIRQDEVIGELMTIAFGDAGELVEWVEGRRHVMSLSSASLALISDISMQRRPDGSVARRVRLHPKIDALDKLARHLSLYGPDGGERQRALDARMVVLMGLPEEMLNKMMAVVNQIAEAPRPEVVETTAYLQGPDLLSAPRDADDDDNDE